MDLLCSLLFVFCFVWSIGGALEAKAQEDFDSFARKEFEGLVALPSAYTLYYYYVDFNDRILKPWIARVPEFKYNSSLQYL
jgi:dynein heavy chain